MADPSFSRVEVWTWRDRRIAGCPSFLRKALGNRARAMADDGVPTVHGVGVTTELPAVPVAMPTQSMNGVPTSPISPFATAASLAQAAERLGPTSNAMGDVSAQTIPAPNRTLASTLAAAVARHNQSTHDTQTQFPDGHDNTTATVHEMNDAAGGENQIDTAVENEPLDLFATSTPSKQLLPPGVTPPPEMLEIAWLNHSNHPMDASIDGVAAAKEAWVCCDESTCGKWRRVPSCVARAIGEHDTWQCSDSRDTRFYSCALPQELYDDEIDRRVNAAAAAERNVLLAEAEQLRNKQKDIEKREKKRKQDLEYRERKKAKKALERREERIAQGLPPDSPPKPPPKPKPEPKPKKEKPPLKEKIRIPKREPPPPPPPTFYPKELIKCESDVCGKWRVVSRQVAQCNVGLRKRWVCAFNHDAPFEERNCEWLSHFLEPDSISNWRAEQASLELAARASGAPIDGEERPIVITRTYTKKEKGGVVKGLLAGEASKQSGSKESAGPSSTPSNAPSVPHKCGSALGIQPDAPRGTVSGYAVDAMTFEDEDAHDDPRRTDGQPRTTPPPKPRGVPAAAVPARCGGHPGVFLPRRAMFRCMCDESLENCASISGVGEGNLLTTTGFERHCGMEKSKNWRTSVAIVCSDRPGLKIGAWLDEVGIDIARGKGGGPGGDHTKKQKKHDKVNDKSRMKLPALDTRWQPTICGPFEQVPLRFLMHALTGVVEDEDGSVSDDDKEGPSGSDSSESRDERRRFLARVATLNKTWACAVRTVVKTNGWEAWKPAGKSLELIEEEKEEKEKQLDSDAKSPGDEDAEKTTNVDTEMDTESPCGADVDDAVANGEGVTTHGADDTRIDAVPSTEAADKTLDPSYQPPPSPLMTEEELLAEEKRRVRREKDKQRKVKEGFVERKFEFDSTATRAQLEAITEYVPRGDPQEVDKERTVTLSEDQPTVENVKVQKLKIQNDGRKLPPPPHVGTKHPGPDAIDRRVKVFWPDENAYFFGVVTGYDPKSKKHTVTYDDGDVENVNLSKEQMEWLEPNGAFVFDTKRACANISDNGDIVDPLKPPGWWPVPSTWPVDSKTGTQQRQKRMGEQVTEQETYGVDYVTARDVVGTFKRVCPDWSDDALWKVSDELMMQVNKSYGSLPIDSAATFSLALAAEDLAETLERDGIAGKLHPKSFSRAAAKALWALAHDSRAAPEMFAVHRKGFGVTCADANGVQVGELVVDFLGEMYPPWAWFAKQDAIKTAQKLKGMRESGPPEFYNMQLERPPGDAEGFALLFVDAMHHNNYAARLSHSCDPNVEVSLRAIDGKYCINFYAKKYIKKGEELCYNYHSCTDNMKEVEAAFCLCGARGCRASYLAFVGEQSNSHVLTRCHRLVERHAALFASGLMDRAEQTELQSSSSVLSPDAIEALEEFGLRPGRGLLRDAPSWLQKYVGTIALFMKHEVKRLPRDILREHRIATEKELKKSQGQGKRWVPPPFGLGDAEIEAMAVRENRLQSIAICLSKVRYLLGRGSLKLPIKEAPPPFRFIDGNAHELAVKYFGNHPRTSLVKVLLSAMAPHYRQGDASILLFSNFKDEVNEVCKKVCGSKGGEVVGGDEDDADDEGEGGNAITASHEDDPSYVAPSMSIKDGLLLLRDMLAKLDVTPGARHDIAADVIHLHAYTTRRWVVNDVDAHASLKAEPIAVRENEVNSFGIGAEGASAKIVKKIEPIYKPHAGAMNLLMWYKQDAFDPGQYVMAHRKGCITLPDVNCAYSPRPEVTVQRGGKKERQLWLSYLRDSPDAAWPQASGPWGVSNHQKILGSPGVDVFVEAHQRGWGTTHGGDPVNEISNEMEGPPKIGNDVLEWLEKRKAYDDE